MRNSRWLALSLGVSLAPSALAQPRPTEAPPTSESPPESSESTAEAGAAEPGKAEPHSGQTESEGAAMASPQTKAKGAASTSPQTAPSEREREMARKIDELERRLRTLEEENQANQVPPGKPSNDQSEEDLDLAVALGAPDAATFAQPQPLKLYGFMDFGFQKVFFPEESVLNTYLATRASTFILGNANVFFDAQPHEDWRGLLEVRFTNLPHGEEHSYNTPISQYEREDTRTIDYTSGSLRNEVVVGSTIIERAWGEWTYSDALQIRAGYFLTPFGIWNVDHGTPTLISLYLPIFQSDQYFPNRQTGVQFLGAHHTTNWELGYRAWVGNGRQTSQVDFTEDKAFGGRLFATQSHGSSNLSVGVSGYYGTDENIEKDVVATSASGSPSDIVVVTRTTEALKEWALGADTALDANDLRLRGEFTVRHMAFEPGKRRPYGGGFYFPDAYYWDSYLLTAYRLPWAGLEPYGYVEYAHFPSVLSDTIVVLSAGLNVHFNPMIQLKNQAAYGLLMDVVTESDRDPSSNDGLSILSRLVVSF